MASPNYAFLKQANKLGPELAATMDQIQALESEAVAAGAKARARSQASPITPSCACQATWAVLGRAGGRWWSSGAM